VGVTIVIGGTMLTRREEGIPSLVLAEQGGRRETRHWHWRDMPTWTVSPLDPAALLQSVLTFSTFQMKLFITFLRPRAYIYLLT